MTYIRCSEKGLQEARQEVTEWQEAAQDVFVLERAIQEVPMKSGLLTELREQTEKCCRPHVTNDENYIPVSLDDWKPREKTNIYRVPSEWRVAQNRRKSTKEEPGNDDFIKINAYLRNGVPDQEILDTFNLHKKILNKIKLGLYCPFTGVLKSEEEKQKEFLRTQAYFNRKNEAKRKMKLQGDAFLALELAEKIEIIRKHRERGKHLKDVAEFLKITSTIICDMKNKLAQALKGESHEAKV